MADLDAIFARIRAGTATHEDAAEMFFSSMTGQMSGVTREQFMAKLTATYPDQPSLTRHLAAYLAAFDAMVAPGSNRMQ